MCSIFAILGVSGDPAALREQALARSKTMRHRGPDWSGLWAGGSAILAHERLAIVDPASGGQPLLGPGGTVLAVNGEIYGHRRVREAHAAYPWRTQSDCEVILALYRAKGADFVHELDGIFAFVLYDEPNDRYVIARDPIGVIPLYTGRDAEGRLHVASEMKALLDDCVSIEEFPPGHVLDSEVGAPRAYYRPTWREFEEVDGGHVNRERVRGALEDAVARQLMTDVPYGVLLSGGLDSSLIVALLAEAGVTGLNTFSIGFETVGGEAGDEFKYSDIIAERFGTHHHKMEIAASRALDALPGAISAMSEPMTSHDCVGFYLLSEEVSKHVKVVQSGQGADEAFAGYHWYPPMAGANDAFATYRDAFFDRSHEEMGELLQPGWLGADHAGEYVRDHFERGGAASPLDKALRLDTQVMLVDDPVKRVDNMTMAWGLEARVPFLDHEVIELAARCPAELHLEQEGKGVLKHLAREILPHEVIDRPKGYFPVPALKYLRGDFLDMVADAVRSQGFRDRGLVRDEYVETLLRDPEAHITKLRGSKLWQIGVLALWLETHDAPARAGALEAAA